MLWYLISEWKDVCRHSHQWSEHLLSYVNTCTLFIGAGSKKSYTNAQEHFWLLGLRTSRTQPFPTFLAPLYDRLLGYSATSHAFRKAAFMTAGMFVLPICAVVEVTTWLCFLALFTSLRLYLFLALVSWTIPILFSTCFIILSLNES